MMVDILTAVSNRGDFSRNHKTNTQKSIVDSFVKNDVTFGFEHGLHSIEASVNRRTKKDRPTTTSDERLVVASEQRRR